MDYNMKKRIVERAKKLKDYEYVHLFRIIKQDSESKYSSNKNGIFINLKNLSDETLNSICEYLDFVESKNTISYIGEKNNNDQKKTDSASLRKLEYENIYHQCYRDLSNYQKTVVKQQGQILNKPKS